MLLLEPAAIKSSIKRNRSRSEKIRFQEALPCTERKNIGEQIDAGHARLDRQAETCGAYATLRSSMSRFVFRMLLLLDAPNTIDSIFF